MRTSVVKASGSAELEIYDAVSGVDITPGLVRLFSFAYTNESKNKVKPYNRYKQGEKVRAIQLALTPPDYCS